MQAVVFVVGSVFLVVFSRRALGHPRSHGFARFFAFELLLGLVVLNAPVWFHDALSVRQIASWLSLLASAALAGHAFHVFHRAERHVVEAAGSDFAWERTTELVTSGAYRWIRHPMYASLLLLGVGALLKAVNVASVVLAAGLTVALIGTARADELETAARFGEAYEAHRARTGMFLPRLRAARSGPPAPGPS
jgi:protein-S-isoprenylcysteine O-methyltransferase Ste14